ncbi:unnamed protein product [Camellia sinensis]
MKDFAGTPGTITGLVLRISQCLFAAGSITSMASTNSFFNITAFWEKTRSLFVGSESGQHIAFSGHIGSNVKQRFLGRVLGGKRLYGLLELLSITNRSRRQSKLPGSVSGASTFSIERISRMGLGAMISYLIASMGLQVMWSFTLAFLDAYALAKKKVVHNHVLVSLFVVGDWVTATLSLAAASASAGITMLYFSDFGGCQSGGECQKFQISVVLAFLSWITIAISSLIMFWILAAG